MTGPYRQSDKARIIFALLAAQVLLLTAALWHHHHDGDAEHPHHPTCVVCLAVGSNTTDTTIADPGPVPDAPVGIVIQAPCARIASRRPDRSHSRGPPPPIA